MHAEVTWDHRLDFPVLREVCSVPIRDRLVTATIRDCTLGSERTRSVTQCQDACLTQELHDSLSEESVCLAANFSVLES